MRGCGDRSSANNVEPGGSGGGETGGGLCSGLKAHLLLAQKRNKMQRDGPWNLRGADVLPTRSLLLHSGPRYFPFPLRRSPPFLPPPGRGDYPRKGRGESPGFTIAGRCLRPVLALLESNKVCGLVASSKCQRSKSRGAGAECTLVSLQVMRIWDSPRWWGKLDWWLWRGARGSACYCLLWNNVRTRRYSRESSSIALDREQGRDN